MTETCLHTQQKREVIRHADVRLPDHWQVQIKNVTRFQLLDETLSEYQEVRNLFDKTMAQKYTNIRIERIQNKQWYTQYNSYKSFSSKEHTERKLFHGCTHESVNLIINSFFNRSFAGVNGLLTNIFYHSLFCTMAVNWFF